MKLLFQRFDFDMKAQSLIARNSILYKIEKRGDLMAVDPVCKMDVDEKEAKWKTEYKGKTYYFCAPGCKTAFEENPEEYM